MPSKFLIKSRPGPLFLILLFAWGIALPSSSFGQSDPRIDNLLAELSKVRSLYQTALSPDGKMLAWVVQGEAGGQRRGREVQVVTTQDSANPMRVSAGSKGELCEEGEIAWSPDSKILAFLSDCENKGQADFYLYQPGAKAAPRRLTRLHGQADSPAFSPDGKKLAFLYVEGGTRKASPLAAEKPPAGVIGEEGVEIKGVGLASLDSGETRMVTPAGLYAYEFDWSPDSAQIVYVAAAPPGENNWWVAQLYTQAVENGRPTSILDPANTSGPLHGLQIAVPRWSPDGKEIAFIGGLMSDQGATGGDVYLVPSPGGEPRRLAENADTTASWIDWRRLPHNFSSGSAPGSQMLLVTGIHGGNAEIRALYPASSTTRTTYGSLPQSVGDGRLELSLSVADGDGQITYISRSFSKGPDVYLGALGAPAKQVTHYNDSLKPLWGKSESISWTSAIQPSPTIPADPSSSAKDFNVQGWLLYPANYDPSKKYPLIVYVHGGPSAATLPRWPGAGFGPAPFAALGYFVLMPNPRGSYGQGEAFVQANRKDFGYGDLRDILAGVDAVTRSHNIDPGQVGITGWSYGGFMTMFAVTQTNRFRAAVAGAGIANWQSYYAQNAIDQWMIPFMGASVYDDPGVYAKMSAVNYVHSIKTPTLAVVGDRDGECPAPQSFEFWHALKAQHVPTQLVVYPNEGHGFVDPEHQRDVIARSLAWFQKYMR